jgi:predicted ABC-type transport system involved in lysophospholipase L1 biosynthesis ATPase subunit
MNSPHPALEAWAQWWNELDDFKTVLKRYRAEFVSQKLTREQAKLVVQNYFRAVRPELIDLGIDSAQIGQLDGINQEILGLAAKKNRTASYRGKLRLLDTYRIVIATAAEIQSANRDVVGSIRLTTTAEASILATLEQIVPSTALSYRQVLQDLGDTQRISYRGTAAELREVLRELLDHLAPDEEVLKTVKLEKDQKGPSMKQKAAFILKARGIGDTARKTPVDAVGTVEESVGSLARSIYTRGSVSTHVVTTRKEVLTIKAYADAVLSDLLQIHR